MNIKTAGDCFIRSVVAQVEATRVDLNQQKWTISDLHPDGPSKYRFKLSYRPTEDILKVARCGLLTGPSGIKIELPWHLSRYDYRAEHLNGGLQLEGDAETHDELLRRVVVRLFLSDRMPPEVRESFYYPSLWVFGFKVGANARRMSDLNPVDIPSTDRQAAHTFLQALHDGLGKCAAQAHLNYLHGFSVSRAQEFGTGLVRDYPALFHRLDAGRYRLTLWGRRVLKDLADYLRGGDFSW